MAIGLALLLPFAACSGDDTPPYPVIEVTPLPSSARAVIANTRQQDFGSGIYLMYAFPLADGGVLDITVDWTSPDQLDLRLFRSDQVRLRRSSRGGPAPS